MNPQYSIPQLKIGCTSFVIPDYYVPAIRQCISLTEDISLLLLEGGIKGQSFLSKGEMKEIVELANDHPSTTWNIHLPTDGDFANKQAALDYADNIKRAIDLTRELTPHSYVMHVVTDKTPETIMRPNLNEKETELILQTLANISKELPTAQHLALENLERHPLDYLDQIINQTDYSRCFDIGHVWKEKERPESLLDSWIERTRMMHLHGIGTRDHQSLHHMPDNDIDAVLHRLWKENYQGAITLEVFKLDDFIQSYHAMKASYERYLTITPSAL